MNMLHVKQLITATMFSNRIALDHCSLIRFIYRSLISMHNIDTNNEAIQIKIAVVVMDIAKGLNMLSSKISATCLQRMTQKLS